MWPPASQTFQFYRSAMHSATCLAALSLESAMLFVNISRSARWELKRLPVLFIIDNPLYTSKTQNEWSCHLLSPRLRADKEALGDNEIMSVLVTTLKCLQFLGAEHKQATDGIELGNSISLAFFF